MASFCLLSVSLIGHFRSLFLKLPWRLNNVYKAPIDIWVNYLSYTFPSLFVMTANQARISTEVLSLAAVSCPTESELPPSGTRSTRGPHVVRLSVQVWLHLTLIPETRQIQTALPVLHWKYARHPMVYQRNPWLIPLWFIRSSSPLFLAKFLFYL